MSEYTDAARELAERRNMLNPAATEYVAELEASLAELVDKLAAEKAAHEEAENYAKEGWAWLDEVLGTIHPDATVFDFKDRLAAEKAAHEETREQVGCADEELDAAETARDQALAERDRLVYWLDQAHRQIKEFRTECDPREDKVLVTHFEMHGAALATTPSTEEPT